MTARRIGSAILIFSACIGLRGYLESYPTTHVLIMLPALALSGWLIIPQSEHGGGEWNRGGVCTILIAIFSIIFWMLPRSIDASLFNPDFEILKFITIPIGVGGALALGWPLAHPVLKGFLKANTISMTGFMSFLYIYAPVRICSAYLQSDQRLLGIAFLVTAITLAIVWTIPLFAYHSQNLLSKKSSS